MGRRVKKTVYDYNSGAWQLDKEILFIYDGWNLVEELITDNGTSTTKYYVWGLDLSQILQGAGGIGGLLAVIDSDEAYHFCYDGNGNVGQLVKVLDSTIAAQYQYDPFGKILYSSGPMVDENPFRFSTKYKDDETGLIWYGFRFYSPQLGRWINRDLIGELGGINLYAFTENDPINLYDPKGLNANNWTCGEIRSWAITNFRTLASPAGLANAKASIGAACTRNGGRCNNVDGSSFTNPIDVAAWNNIVNANGGADLSGGGNYMCVGHPTQGCPYVTQCKTCCNGRVMWVNRATQLVPTGTVTVAGMSGGTLYFYNDPHDWWCNADVKRAGGCPRVRGGGVYNDSVNCPCNTQATQ